MRTCFKNCFIFLWDFLSSKILSPLNRIKYASPNFSQLSFSQLGFSLLEFSVALPIVMSVMVGAFDVSQVLHANSVARESVETALRCMYSTDSECQKVTQGTRHALYDIEKSTVVTTSPAVSYTGEFAQLEGPAITYQATAKVFGGVTYSYGGNQQTVTGSNMSQDIQYLTVGPTVFGNLIFTNTARNTNSSRPPDFSQNISGISLGQAKFEDNTEEIAFDTSRKFIPLNGQTIFSSLTSPTAPLQKVLDDHSIPIIFKVYGESNGNEACSDVTLSLLMTDADTKKTSSQGLGGQFIAPQPDGDANFFLRGAPNGDNPAKENTLRLIDDENDKREFALYPSVTIDLSKKYRLHFAMHYRPDASYQNSAGQIVSCGNTGNIGWIPTKVDFWFPQVTTVNDTIGCKNIKSDCNAANYTCDPILTQKYSSVYPLLTKLAVNKTSAVSCSAEGLAEVAYASLSNSCKQAACYTAATLKPSPQESEPITIECPKGSDGVYSNKGISADSTCPIPAPPPGKYVVSSKWNEVSETLPTATYNVATCGDTVPSLAEINPGWASYPNISFKEVSRTTYRFGAGKETENSWGGDSDPNNLVKNDPRYSCGRFKVYKGTTKELKFTETNHFSDAQPISCSMPTSKQLRDEIAAIKAVGENSYIVTGKSDAAMQRVVACPACGACSVEAGAGSPTVIAHNQSQGQYPAECSLPGASCSAKFVGFSEGDPTQSKTDNAKAVEAAATQIKTFLPWIPRDCPPPLSDGPFPTGCPSIKIDDKTVTTNGVVVHVTSNIKVPTISGALFQPGSSDKAFEVSYSDSRLAESSFTR